MITGKRTLFESRCRERGYTLAQVRPCIVAEAGDMITVDDTHPAYPRRRDPEAPWRPIPIGDVVERWLTRIGLSKARVERWTRRVGVKDCGCRARQKWLNEFGNAIQIRARNALVRARRFYVGN